MDSQRELVLHVDFISIAAMATAGRAAIVEAAADLARIEGVIGVGAIKGSAASDYDLAVYCLVATFMDLEPFGTHPRYTRFLQGTVAPYLRAFSGADVRLDGPLVDSKPFGACIAAEAAAETYDWEVSQQLAGWAESFDGAVVGLAIGERQRYRGVALGFSDRPLISRPSLQGFDLTYVSGAARRLA